MNPTLLEVKNLHLRYAGSREAVLRGCTLAMAPGETVAIIGESGCGKTTLAWSILGLLPATANIEAGQIAFQGRDLSALSSREWQRLRWQQLAVVMQASASSFNPLRQVGPQVAEVLRLHERQSKAEACQRVFALFEEAGLSDVARCYRAYPHEMSSGMLQRAAIAMAIACRPALIIADEPTSALDAAVADKVLHCLQWARRRTGAGLLLISHNIAQVAGCSDRIAVMANGAIVECRSPALLLAQPRHPQTRRLLAAAEALQPQMPVPAEPVVVS